MPFSRDIAIIGMACVFPKAPNLQAYWSNLANGVDAVDQLPADRWHEHTNFTRSRTHEAFIPSSRGGYLPTHLGFDPMPFGVLPNLVRHGDPDQFFMLHVVRQALADAQVAEDHPVRERTDVIIGRGGYATGKLVELTLRTELYDICLEALDRKFPEISGSGRRAEFEAYLRSTLTPVDIDNVSSAVSNITASRTANRLNLRGAAYTVDGACASSLLAAEHAVSRLRNGQCDLAVAAGLFLSLTPTFMYVFTRLGALSPSGMIRPLDRRADGLLAGEGGGAVILKRYEDACRDGDSIYAVIRGVGTASDGKEVDVLAPASSGQLLALERAYTDAQIDPETIGYLEMHGTGTIVGDGVEIDSIKQFFGTSPTLPSARAMGSVKSMIGHTMPAAGMASLIKTALSLTHKTLLPSLHCEEPRPELDNAPFYVNTQTRPWIHNVAAGPRRAGVNAFGFGGINAHVVLEEVPQRAPRRSKRLPRPRPVEPAVARPSELCVFTADSRDDLRARLQHVRQFLDLDQSGITLADVAYSLSQEVVADHSHKLACIARDLDELRQQLDVCIAARDESEFVWNDESVYFSPHAARHEGKIALIFPGMGFPGLIGNYPDHLMELCLHYPEVRAEFDFFEDRDRHPEDRVPTSSIFSPPASLPEEYRARLKGRLAPPRVDIDPDKKPEAEERYLAAMGVTLSNWVGWVLLEKLDLPIDMITGQSQGEMAAVCVAGVADFHASAPSFWKVLNVDPRNTDGHRLAFAWATAEKVEPLLAANPGTHLAIYMAPEGIILGGPREGLLRVAEKLREEQILVQLLPYPAIHTPSLSHLRQELVEALGEADTPLRAPQMDVYSSITTEKYPRDPQGIRETLMLNVDRPLKIWQTIRRMYEDGARIFVQVGGGHMAAHLERLLPEGAPVTTAALDVDTRDPITQLNHLVATLFTAGVPLSFRLLYEHRKPRRLDFTAPGAAPAPPRGEVPLRIDWSPLYSPNVPPRTHAPAEASPPPAVAENGLAARANGSSVAAAETVALPVAPALQDTPEEPPLLDPDVTCRLPVVGRGKVVQFVAEASLVIERGLDLENDLFLHDHLFVYADKPVDQCLPILPLTFSLEFLAEAGALLSPGLGLIGYEEIRGLRWTGLRDCRHTPLRIEATVESTDAETGVRRIKGRFFFEDKPSFSATVLFGPEYRQDVSFDMVDCRGDGPWPYTPEQVYSERHMFHGPTFHCLAGLETLGNPGASGSLAVMPKDRMLASCSDPLLLTDPYLMDGIGQVVGLWATYHEHYILPTAVDKIEFYCPTPPLGTICPIRIEVIEFNADTKQIRCNVEIENGAGQVWVRVAGWTEWMLNWTTRYADATRLPSRYVLSSEISLPGLPADTLCMLARREDFAGIDLDWAARIFLNSRDLPEYWATSDTKARRQLLLSQVAVRDAARTWIARRDGTAYRHPADLLVGHDRMGAVCLENASTSPLPQITMVDAPGVGIGVASAVPVQVAVSPWLNLDTVNLSSFASVDELGLLEELETTDAGAGWHTRLWCAKQAVGRLLGQEALAQPLDLEAVDADTSGCLILRHEPSGERFVVRSLVVEGLLLAYTTGAEKVLPTSREIVS